MRTRRLLLTAPCAAAMASIVACNLIVGTYERTIDEGDAATRAEASVDDRPDGAAPTGPDDAGQVPSPPAPDDAGADAGADAAVVQVPIDVGGAWTSVNGGTAAPATAGLTITSYTTSDHPIVVPSPPPVVASDDYTVLATVHAGLDGEFGLVARVQTDGSCVLLGSKFGSSYYPWIGSAMASVDNFNPSLSNHGLDYVFTAGARYKLKLQLRGSVAYGKTWRIDQPEPETPFAATIPWSTGKSAGFYTYNILSGVVLESIAITVP